MSATPIEKMPLAELHALASERGIERFRMLTRSELIEALGGDAGPDGDGGPEAASEGAEPEAGEPVEGVLEITSRGHGFIRRDDDDEGDVYVSPSQIRRCELEAGDLVAGPARRPRRGERHPALVHVDRVNGAEPGEGRTRFETLEAVPPRRRIALTGSEGDENAALLLRAIDLLTPLARGQRVLVNAPRGSGRTTLLRALVRELAAVEDLSVTVALVDERPEEEAGWREIEDIELESASADMRPREQLRVVERAVAGAKRRAERGADVVLVVDSLSRLAVAADDPGAAKPIFAAGRETAGEDVGSLTVIATTLSEGDGVMRALETTENVTVSLDPEIAAAGVFPAIRIAECRISGEEELREDSELAAVRALRAELAAAPAAEAAERLAERLRAYPDNSSLLDSLDAS